MEMVKFKDLKDHIKEFKVHLKAVAPRVNDEQKMKVLQRYIDQLSNPQEVINKWDMCLFDNTQRIQTNNNNNNRFFDLFMK